MTDTARSALAWGAQYSFPGYGPTPDFVGALADLDRLMEWLDKQLDGCMQELALIQMAHPLDVSEQQLECIRRDLKDARKALALGEVLDG